MAQMFPELLTDKCVYCQVLGAPEQWGAGLGASLTKAGSTTCLKVLPYTVEQKLALGPRLTSMDCLGSFSCLPLALGFSLHTIPCSGHVACLSRTPDQLDPPGFLTPGPSQQPLPSPVSWCGFLGSPRFCSWAHFSVILGGP